MRCVVCLCDIKSGEERYCGDGPFPRCPTCYEHHDVRTIKPAHASGKVAPEDVERAEQGGGQ